MRYGFTTGSCSAAAAKAAAYMLLSGKRKEQIVITTPKGLDFHAEILDIHREEQMVSCAVEKDGGDDPDATSGAWIYAQVSLLPQEVETVRIDGGEGVGRVTKPGLDQPVGNAAINSVPRSMIEKEVREVMGVLDYHGGLQVIISVPKGTEIAPKTFNERLGILGGISILGTSGVVEPMSVQALLDTIQVELQQKKAMGAEDLVIAPGNYGLDFMQQTYDYHLDRAVKCSNYIGQTLDMIGDLGFRSVVLCGHVGKLIKVSGGIMNTHSHEADCRIELMVNAGLHAGMTLESLKAMQQTIATEAALEIVEQQGCLKPFMEYSMERAHFYLKKRAQERFQVECIMFSNVYGLLGETDGARAILERIRSKE